MRLGGPIVNAPTDPDALAHAHVAMRYRAAYIPGDLTLADGDRVRAIRDAFARVQIPFAEAGAWCNLVSPDPAKRRANFDYVCGRLALADELGARCCVDYLGTCDPDSDYGPHPDNLKPAAFAQAVEVIRAVVDAVKPRRAVFALEMMQWMLPDSVRAYAALLKAVDRPMFGVHLDPVNLIVTPRQYYQNGRLIRDCFRALGSRIASCHAKDLILRNQLALHLDEVRPGLGQLDYRTYLKCLHALPGDVPLMLEHLATADDYAAARAHLAAVADRLGIPV